ncbi:MAG: prepilin-type N-terminal cleavage/methylation domain-containing protein, partial [Patescibacteria group bacterium]
KGFTLIELLVVISIISLLSSIVLMSLKSSKDRALNAKIVEETRQIALAMEQYRNANGKYYKFPGDSGNPNNWVRGWVPTEIATFKAAMKPYIDFDKISIVGSGTNNVFHYNDGESVSGISGYNTCGGNLVKRDGYVIGFRNPANQSVLVTGLPIWGADSSYNCMGIMN